MIITQFGGLYAKIWPNNLVRIWKNFDSISPYQLYFSLHQFLPHLKNPTNKKYQAIQNIQQTHQDWKSRTLNFLGQLKLYLLHFPFSSLLLEYLLKTKLRIINKNGRTLAKGPVLLLSLTSSSFFSLSLFSLFPSFDHSSRCQAFLKQNEDLSSRRHLCGILLLIQLYSPFHFSPSSLIHLDIQLIKILH